jgi:hypothetical protein
MIKIQTYNKYFPYALKFANFEMSLEDIAKEIGLEEDKKIPSRSRVGQILKSKAFTWVYQARTFIKYFDKLEFINLKESKEKAIQAEIDYIKKLMESYDISVTMAVNISCPHIIGKDGLRSRISKIMKISTKKRSSKKEFKDKMEKCRKDIVLTYTPLMDIAKEIWPGTISLSNMKTLLKRHYPEDTDLWDAWNSRPKIRKNKKI